MNLMSRIRSFFRLTTARIIIFGFLLVILFGAVLLTLPISSQSGDFTPFSDAFFTATSATCVTGLVVHDTATYWSYFGQAVILCLIQIGGMGVVTIAVTLTRISGKKIGLRQRNTMQESVSAMQLGGIVRYTSFIAKGIMFFEIAGALLLMPVMIHDFGIGKGIWYSFFHSISAFCNAGFDLMGVKEQYSSLTGYASSYYVNFVIMALIVIGGIGFLTWDDIRKNKFRFNRYRMQTKTILTVSGLLIIVPAIFFFFSDFSGDRFADFSVGERITASLFQSVTTRTAGFNTVDLTQLREGSVLIMIVMMAIGGSPGSTAGGMKTTTAAVIIAAAISVFRRRPDPQLFRRRTENSALNYAISIFILYFVLIIFGGIFISNYESLPLLSTLFESASAVGTVGLTLGITTQLHLASRCVIMFLMFAGRVGGLTLVFAAFSDKKVNVSKLPQEKISVG